MKKILLIIICVILVFGLTACGNKEVKNKVNSVGSADMVSNNSNSLVLYFSATGVTEGVAKIISKVTNSDIIRIIPEEEYTDDDLDYNNNESRANKEQNDDKARPGIKNDIDISGYDIIYLGYPIWWGTNPKIILTLLDTVNFANKRVVLFCTSGSTDIKQSSIDIKQYNDKINVVAEKRFGSNTEEKEVTKWINSLKLYKEVDKMYIKVGNRVLSVTLEDNSSSKALLEKLREKDITINMSDYGNFEKVGKLGFNLPTNDRKITTIPGDVILYQGNSITIYYDTNNWNFTKLGKIDNISKEELKDILGDESVSVTFSIDKN